MLPEFSKSNKEWNGAVKLGIQNSQKLHVLRLPVDFLKYGNNWYITAFLFILPATFSELFYELYGTNADDDRLQGLFLHVVLIEGVLGNDSHNTWARCPYELCYFVRVMSSQKWGTFNISDTWMTQQQWKKNVSVALHAMSAPENCSSFPRLFLEWHYWMLCCYQLSIELSVCGYEILASRLRYLRKSKCFSPIWSITP